VVEFVLAICKEFLLVCFVLRPATLAKAKKAPEDPPHEVANFEDGTERFPSFPNVEHDLVCVGLLNLVSYQVALQIYVVFSF